MKKLVFPMFLIWVLEPRMVKNGQEWSRKNDIQFPPTETSFSVAFPTAVACVPLAEPRRTRIKKK